MYLTLTIPHYPWRVLKEPAISAADTSKLSRAASARAFVHSLNILVKYVRLYGFSHKRTEHQFEVTWNELKNGLPSTGEAGFLLGVSGQTLLLDGVPLETGQAERSFAQLLTTAGLASIHFSTSVTSGDFERLVRAFATSTSKAQDLSKQIKESFGDNKTAAIRINEVKFVAADPATGEVNVASQIASQTLGPEFKEWLNDPQKLLQLIAAAEGAQSGGASTVGQTSNAPSAGTPVVPRGMGLAGTGQGGGDPGKGISLTSMVPLEEEEVVRAIRLLTKFGQAGSDATAKPEVQKELEQAPENTKVNLRQLLNGLASTVPADKTDTPLLMKAAEHMAIRFALDKFQKGDVKVNAVHQMLEHMSRQMDTLRQILRIQEDKMSKAGILVESHADILDRMFWAEVPEAGKKSVLLSNDAPCVPPRNIRQFLELLLGRGDKEPTASILENYVSCLEANETEPRKKTAIGLSQLADLFAETGPGVMGKTARKIGEALARENDTELQGLLGAAFVRLSSEACNRKQYSVLSEVCESLEFLTKHRPVLAHDLRPRIGVENRLPELIEEAIAKPEAAKELLNIFRRTTEASIEHFADRFFRCMRREECDRMVEVVKQLEAPAVELLRELLRTGQARQAAAVIGLLSRLDVPSLLELLPTRLKEWNRFYHDIVVRQIAYGAAADRGRTLLELVEVLNPLVLTQALDEIGMSGDRTAVPPLIVMAESGQAQDRSALVQIKALEALGRLREAEAVPALRRLLEEKRHWKWAHHRELRIVAAQALAKIDPRYGSQVLSDNGLQPAELAIAPLDAAPACPWVRQRRYERIALAKSLPATLSSSWGKTSLQIRELSLGGGMGTKEDNLRIGSEANLEISLGMRRIRAQVLLRRARQNEVGFEIVNIDLESRLRLRGLLVGTLDNSPTAKISDWNGQRKV